MDISNRAERFFEKGDHQWRRARTINCRSSPRARRSILARLFPSLTLIVQIAEAYKKKIESIVRKPTKQEEEEPVTPCPYCACKSPCTSLDCIQCKNRVPYCIATGLRMVANDWTFCPSCRFPALYSKFKALIDSEKVIVSSSAPLKSCGSICA